MNFEDAMIYVCDFIQDEKTLPEHCELLRRSKSFDELVENIELMESIYNAPVSSRDLCEMLGKCLRPE